MTIAAPHPRPSYQPMSPLSATEYEALREDIRTGRSITGCDVDAYHVATARQRVDDVLADQDIT